MPCTQQPTYCASNSSTAVPAVLQLLPQRSLLGVSTPPHNSQVARGSLAAAVAGGYLFVYGGGKPNEQYNVVEWCAALCWVSCCCGSGLAAWQ